MVATSVTAGKSIAALTKVRDLAEQYGTDEQKERLHEVMGGSIPSPNKLPVEHATYVTEALAVLFELVAEIKEAQKPRPRGRPPKKTDDAA
jgi:hypothetical protein